MGKRIKRRKIHPGSKVIEDTVASLIQKIEGKVAVYIDAANLEKSVQALGLIPPEHLKKGTSWRPNKDLWHVDYEKLHRFFDKNTKLANVSFYTARFNTTSHDRFLTFLKNCGYRLVTKPVKTILGRGRVITCEHCGYKTKIPNERKANFDVEISVDAINWLNNYDTFVLFSGDSDFVYLAKLLKRKGKRVIILARRGHIANELRSSRNVDYYQDIWKFREEFLKKSS